MLENFIYAKEKSLFEEALSNGEVLDEAIVFIEDTKEIWNHGTYFDGSTFDPSNIEESIAKLEEEVDEINFILVDAGGSAEEPDAPVYPSDLENYVTEEELEAKGYITASQVPNPDLSSYITKEDAHNYTDTAIANLVDSAPETLNTLNELATAISEHQDVTDALDAAISNKADKTEIPTKISQLENDSNYIQDDVISDGIYAVDANGKLIDYTTADSSCLGVAIVAGEHKFMIAKKDATNDGRNYELYYDRSNDDLSLTNYSNADGTNDYGYLPRPNGSYQSTPNLSPDFTTWTEGALSDFNGKSNTEVIAASSSNAKDMCKALETFNAGSDNQGHTDWYVPACGQLALMYLAKTDINAALAKIGGTTFGSDYYWSSSECDANDAWRVFFYNGYVSFSGKSDDYQVRFVRDISVKSLKEKVSDLESNISNKADKSDVEVEVEVEAENGVYAITAEGKLIDYNTADDSCLGVALVAGEHKFTIAKADAANDTDTVLQWSASVSDLSLTNYSNADGTNNYGFLSDTLTPNLNKDFTTWTAGALSDFNGKANTTVIAEASSDGSDMCTVLNTFNASDSYNDWYVPACGQLALIYLNITEINVALAKIGGTALSSNLYWSSSEYDSRFAWSVDFRNGIVGFDSNKYNYVYVRFVRDLTTTKTVIKKSLKERASELESKISALELQIQEILTRIQ